MVKVPLTPFFRYDECTCYLKSYAEKFWIRLNFLCPDEISKIQTPPFCFPTEFEENGFSGYCDVYVCPGRLNISRALSALSRVLLSLKRIYLLFEILCQNVFGFG